MTGLVPSAVLTGLAVGGWIALIFALRPLLALRNVSPLQTLRRDTDADVLRMQWTDVPRIVVNVAMVLSVVLIALTRARTAKQAIGMSGATGFAILALTASADYKAARWLAQRDTVGGLHKSAKTRFNSGFRRRNRECGCQRASGA